MGFTPHPLASDFFKNPDGRVFDKTVVSGPRSLQGEGSIRDRWQVVCTDVFICWDQIVINHLMLQVRLTFIDGLLELVLLLGNIIYLF